MSLAPASPTGARTAAASPAQLRAALWAREGARVHAVIDGAVVPGLAQRLKDADVPGYDTVQRGALAPLAAQQAACIVELPATGPFTDWLLEEAATSYPDWGVLMVSVRPLLAMREFSRDLAEVRMPDGRRRPWRWWDPQLLETLLPVFTPDQVSAVFAAGQQLVLVSPQRWVWWQLVDGVAQRQARDRLQKAG